MSMQGLAASAAANPVSGVPLAIVCGVALANAPFARALFAAPLLAPGLKFCSTHALRAGIVCIGLKLSFVELAVYGTACVPVACAAVATGLWVVPWLGRVAGLPPRMATLIAAGTSICGVTAITACAPAIKVLVCLPI